MTEQELLEYIRERLTWIKEACEIDRDADFELYSLIATVRWYKDKVKNRDKEE